MDLSENKKLTIAEIVAAMASERLEQHEQIIDTEDCKSTIDVIRQSFDLFERLISTYEKNTKLRTKTNTNAVNEIAEILYKSGVRKSDGSQISKHQISVLMNQVRRERGGVKQVIKTSNSVRSKVLAQSQAFKIRNEEKSAVKQSSEFVVAGKIKESSKEGLARLNKEAIGGWSEGWLGQDEYLLGVLFNQYLEVKNQHISPKFWEVTKNANFSFTSEEFKEIARLLKIKLEALGLFAKYRDMA